MKENFQPAGASPATVSKWPQALVLSVGLSGACMQAQAAQLIRAGEETYITTDRTMEIMVYDQETFIAPGVAVNISNQGSQPAVSVFDGGILHMDQGSKITVDGIGVHDGLWIRNGEADLNGAIIVVDGVTADAIQMVGGGQANLVDTSLSALGIEGHALVMYNTDSILPNTVSITGGSLSSIQAEAVLIKDTDSTVSLDNVEVDGTNAIRVNGTSNTLSVTNATLTGSVGAAVLMDGTNGDVTLRDTTVSSSGGVMPTVDIAGSGNTFNMSGGKLDVTGRSQAAATVSALRVEGGQANIIGTEIVTHGNNTEGVRAYTGADIYLEGVAISTDGGHSRGVLGMGENGKIVMSGGSVSTAGDLSDGLTVRGGIEASVTGVRIDVSGNHSHGVVVTADSSVDIRNSVINMTNDASYGAAYVVGGGVRLHAADVDVSGAGTITGLLAAGSTVSISGGSIKTEDGLGATVSGGADVSISNGAQILTTGAGAHAIQFYGDMRSKITVDGATLAAQGAEADIFHGDGGAADVIVSNGANISTDGKLLNLQSSNGAGSDVNFVVDNAVVKGDIIADNASTANVTLRNGAALTARIDPVVLTVESGGQWNASGDSSLTSLTLNGGTVNFMQPQNGVFKTIQTTTLDGAGGRIVMLARLDDDAAPADLLHITGDASGSHVLEVHNAGGTGAQTNGDGIHLVQADGRSDADNFSLAGGAVQAGMYEYFLAQGGQSRASDWYLRSTRRAGLSAYVLMPTLNRDFGYSTIGTLHERTGDLGNIVRNDRSGEGSLGSDGVWGRISGAQLRTGSSEQIDANARSSFMQFGKDWTLDADVSGASTHAGVTATLGEMHASFSDDKRLGSGTPAGRDTGTAKTRAMGVGGYWTRYFADGTYVDAVGQLSRYGTDYKDAYALEASSKGTGLALSVEAGKPFASYGSLRLEAQGQMIYQYLRMDGFNDGVSEIAANGTHGLRGRVGVRIFQEMQDGDTPRSAAPYAIVNVWRNISGAASVGIDGQSLQTQTNKTWGEVGVGITGRLSERGMLHAGLKYRHQLGGLQFEGAAGEVGYRYTW